MKFLLFTLMLIVSMLISGRLAFLLTPNPPDGDEIFSSGVMIVFFWLVWLGLCPVVLKILDFCLFSKWYVEKIEKHTSDF